MAEKEPSSLHSEKGKKFRGPTLPTSHHQKSRFPHATKSGTDLAHLSHRHIIVLVVAY